MVYFKLALYCLIKLYQKSIIIIIILRNKPNKFTCTNFELHEFKAARISLKKVREIKSREFKAERKWVPLEFKYK